MSTKKGSKKRKLIILFIVMKLYINQQSNKEYNCQMLNSFTKRKTIWLENILNCVSIKEQMLN